MGENTNKSPFIIIFSQLTVELYLLSVLDDERAKLNLKVNVCRQPFPSRQVPPHPPSDISPVFVQNVY